MLEPYQTNLELNDPGTTDYFAEDLPEIRIYGEQDPEIAIEEADVDTSVVGVAEDRTGEEYEITDIAIASLIEAVNIARTADSMGVIISPERALRAGQIRTGEVVVDPDYRDNGRNNLPPQEEAVFDDHEPLDDLGELAEEAVPEPTFSYQVAEAPEESVDQSLPTTESAVEIAEEDESFDGEIVQPTQLTASNDHEGDERDNSEAIPEEIIEQDVDLATPPSSGEGGDKPPIETSSSETDFPDEDPEGNETGEPSSPHRHFAQGQLRSVIRDMAEALAEAGVDVDPMLTSKQRQVLPLLLSEISNEEIAEQLGHKSPSVSKMSHLIIERVIGRAPEGMDLKSLAQPAGPIVEEGPNTSVGGILNTLREQKGITIDSLVEQFEGRSRRAIQRFFAGTAHPHTTQMILPLLKILEVPEEEASMLLRAYRTEKQQKAERHDPS